MTTIYLSSTYEDLKDYRRVVFEALRKSGYQVIAMEDYVATDRLLFQRRLRNSVGLGHGPYNMTRVHCP
jgi:acyl-coenzyme A thioesterase PaaI-like protein